MDEIKVGEYVRTKQGYIAKIIKIDEQFIWCDDVVKGYDSELIQISGDNEYEDTYKDIIKLHSSIPIDLIEKDDYVNGERVLVVAGIITDGGEKAILVENYDEWTDDGVITNKDIKSIVTHEQFAQIEYKVEE